MLYELYEDEDAAQAHSTGESMQQVYAELGSSCAVR